MHHVTHTRKIDLWNMPVLQPGERLLIEGLCLNQLVLDLLAMTDEDWEMSVITGNSGTRLMLFREGEADLPVDGYTAWYPIGEGNDAEGIYRTVDPKTLMDADEE